MTNQVLKTKKSMEKTSTNNLPAVIQTDTAFEYERMFMNPKRLQVHELLKIVGYDEPDEIFKERAKYFNYYERPVVTGDGYVINQIPDFLAALQSNVPELEVVVMKNVMVNDIIDFISFKHVWKHGKSRRKMYEMAKVLTEYVQEKDKAWKDQFKSNKTRGIVAEMAGVSDGTIQSVTAIGNYNPELLDEVDNKKITASQALKIVKPKKPNAQKKKKQTDDTFTSRKRHAGILISNAPNIDSGEKAKLKVTSAVFEIEEVGRVDFKINEKSSTVCINGKLIGEVTHNVVSDRDFEGKRDYSQHHTLLPNDDSFDFQFIMRGIEKYIINETKMAA